MDVHKFDEFIRKLTPHQRKILQLMYDAEGDWLTRAMVAKRLNKRRLTPYDINCLNMLAEENILMMETQPTTAPGSDFAYIYSMSDQIADTLQQWFEMKNALNNTNTQKKTRKPINLTEDD